jgi:hypothetical protein
LPHTPAERRRGTLERGGLAEKNAAGTNADLVSPGMKRSRRREHDQKACESHGSQLVHENISSGSKSRSVALNDIST